MNKNFIVNGTAILITASLLQVMFPWWIIVVPCFVFGAFRDTNKFLNSFLTGFISIALLWGTYAALIQLYTGSELSSRISVMFHLPSNDFVGIVSALIGGFVGGLSALCGDLINWSSTDLTPSKDNKAEEESL
ncbi:hypothetical protein [Flammeovirga kamogawensis]|uniref:Uncharacterized protein n=1 Tax=Flammeovirga kamogawensis TaxID=373891 RepID=A0ABX8GWX7_9BACT|nr:hypothetical protein [Flammeovirga kamogawensis]MBB6461273.1 putative membrane protein [Flammeovirga kamogawensis]QWG07832.1 hypothetical protein KM029_02505 [Flammeovirga kamogawensis]TRX69637.1 hypothetical protein EO216_16440 [Flammeovirga kamogawensis]